MANITNNWNASMPSGTSLVSQGDDLMRQHWNSLEITLEEEHYFDDSPTSAGIHKAGASRISYGDLTSVKTTPEEGRAFYAVDDQSLHLTGLSATTKISGAQIGGPVRSQESGTYGWYITSYRTTYAAPNLQYKWANSNGNPMTFINNNSTNLLTLSAITGGPSTNTFIYLPIPFSLSSRGVYAHIALFSDELGGTAAAGSAGFTNAPTGSAFVQVSAIGLIAASELS